VFIPSVAVYGAPLVVPPGPLSQPLNPAPLEAAVAVWGECFIAECLAFSNITVVAAHTLDTPSRRAATAAAVVVPARECESYASHA